MARERRSTRRKKPPTPESSPTSTEVVSAGSVDDEEFVVEAVVDHITYKEAVKKFSYGVNGFVPACYLQKSHCKYIFRVKWFNYGSDSDTWEVEENLLDNEKYIQYKSMLSMPKGVQKENFMVRDFLKKCYLAGDPEISDEVRAILEKQHGKIPNKESAEEEKKKTPASSRKKKRTQESDSTPVSEKKRKNPSAASSSRASFPPLAINDTPNLPGENSPISSKVPRVTSPDISRDSSPELVVKKPKLDNQIVSPQSEMDTEAQSVDSSDSAALLTVRTPKAAQEKESSSTEVSSSANNSPNEPAQVVMEQTPQDNQKRSQSPSKSASKSPHKTPPKEPVSIEDPKLTDEKTSSSLSEMGSDLSPPMDSNILETPKEAKLTSPSQDSSSVNSSSKERTPLLEVDVTPKSTGEKSTSGRRRKRPNRSPSSSSKESTPELIVKKTKKDDSPAVNESTPKSSAKKKKKETPSGLLRESSTDVAADKMDKNKDTASLWISETKKQKQLEKKRKIVEEQERERIASLDTLEELEERLKQKKKSKKQRESRESRDSETEDGSRKEKRNRKSIDRSASPEVSFRQREKRQEEIRLNRKKENTALNLADSDIFENGSAIFEVSASAATAKKRHSIDVAVEPRNEEHPTITMNQPQAIERKKGFLSEHELARIRKMKSEEDKRKKAKEHRPKPVVLPTLNTRPPTSAVPPPPKKKYPPVPSASGSGIDLMDNITSSMDKVRTTSDMPFSPSPAPVPPSPFSPTGDNLMLKTAPKPKKDFRIPNFDYNSQVASSASSSFSNGPKRVPPIVISRRKSTGAPYSPQTTENESDSMADYEPSPKDFESSTMDVDEEPTRAPAVKVKMSKDKEDEKEVSVVRQLTQPFYPTYHYKLLKDLGLLEKRSYTTDDLPLEKSNRLRMKAKFWEDFDKTATADFKKLRTDNLSSIHLQFSDLRIHVPMVWNDETKTWKRAKGRGDEVKQTLKEISDEIRASPPKVFKVIAPNEIPSKTNAPAALKEMKHESQDGEDVPDRSLVHRNDIEAGHPPEYYRTLAIEAYNTRKYDRLREIICNISSALYRFRLVKELSTSLIPNTKGDYDEMRPWLVESDSCNYDEWWHGLQVCGPGDKHIKCKLMGTLMSVLPHQFRFHSEGPFNTHVFMHCITFGSFCQKAVFFEYGVPRCLHEFVKIPQPKKFVELALEPIHVILCQSKPWQVIEFLRKGHCVNSLIWRHLPANFESSPVTRPAVLSQAFKEIIESGAPLDPALLENIAKGMSFFAKALQAYMKTKIDLIVESNFVGFGTEALTPVHTVVSTSPSETANAFTYIIEGSRVWNNLTDDNYGGIDEEDIDLLKKKEAFVVITVARINVTGGIQVNSGGRSVSPLGVQPLFGHDATPVALSLCATSAYSPPPLIVLKEPQTMNAVDTWFFVIPPHLSDELLKMVKHRVRIALDTDGKIGIKFLVQMYLLDKKLPGASATTSTAPSANPMTDPSTA